MYVPTYIPIELLYTYYTFMIITYSLCIHQLNIHSNKKHKCISVNYNFKLLKLNSYVRIYLARIKYNKIYQDTYIIHTYYTKYVPTYVRIFYNMIITHLPPVYTYIHQLLMINIIIINKHKC